MVKKLKNKIEKLINDFNINIEDKKASTEKDKDDLLSYIKTNFNLYEEQLTDPLSTIFKKFAFIHKHIYKESNIKINDLEKIFSNYTSTVKKAKKISIKEIRKIDYFFARPDTTNASNQKMVKSGILAPLLIFYKNNLQPQTKIKFIDPLKGEISIFKTKNSIYSYLEPVNSNNRLYGCKLFSPIIEENSYIIFDELIYKNYDNYIFEFLSEFNNLLEKLEIYNNVIFEITINKEFQIKIIVNKNYENQKFVKIRQIDEKYIKSKLPINVIFKQNFPIIKILKLFYLKFKQENI